MLINDAPPSTSDKILSVIPYLFPLLDGLQYGRFLLQDSTDPITSAVALLYIVYRSVPFSGFAAFFALNFLSGNPRINRLVRFNMQQAIFLDIALILPGLIGGITGVLGLTTPAGISEILNDGTFFVLLATLLYCAGSSVLGKEPSALPIISQAVKDRMPGDDWFDEEGNFRPPSRGKKEEDGGDDDTDSK